MFRQLELIGLPGSVRADSSKRGIFPDTVLILAIERADQRLIPNGDTVVESEDVLTVFSLERASDELVDRLTG